MQLVNRIIDTKIEVSEEADILFSCMWFEYFCISLSLIKTQARILIHEKWNLLLWCLVTKQMSLEIPQATPVWNNSGVAISNRTWMIRAKLHQTVRMHEATFTLIPQISALGASTCLASIGNSRPFQIFFLRKYLQHPECCRSLWDVKAINDNNEKTRTGWIGIKKYSSKQEDQSLCNFIQDSASLTQVLSISHPAVI